MLVLTEVFVGIARKSATKLGISDPRLAVIEHPLGGLAADAVRSRAVAAVEVVLSALGVGEQPIEEIVGYETLDIDGALAGLRAGFAADGADLVVESVDPLIVLRLVLTDKTTSDCLVAPAVLRGIVEEALAPARSGREVIVIDPRDP